MLNDHIIRTGEKMTRVYALKEHNLKKNEEKDFIAIRSEDGYLYINIPKEKIEEALKRI